MVPFSDAAILVLTGEDALTVQLIVDPMALDSISIGPFEGALAMPLIHFELTVILCAAAIGIAAIAI